MKDVKTSSGKINNLMMTFSKISDTMNEKRSLLISTYHDREMEVMKRLSFTPTLVIGKLIIQKRTGYNIVRNEEQVSV